MAPPMHSSGPSATAGHSAGEAGRLLPGRWHRGLGDAGATSTSGYSSGQVCRRQRGGHVLAAMVSCSAEGATGLG